jgi:hypothetical protein
MASIEQLQRDGWTVTFPDTIEGERLSVRAKKGTADHGQFYEPGKLDAALELLAEKVANHPQKDANRPVDPERAANLGEPRGT